MRNVRQILEYRLSKQISADQTALALSISKGTVINTVHRFEQTGLSWPLPQEMTDTALETALYPKELQPSQPDENLPLPDLAYLEKELHRPHMTLQRLWEEYDEAHPGQISRATFYRYWQQHRPVAVHMKMMHKGGDKLFVDFSGDGLEYIDRSTGEVFSVELFVCCWGASSYSFAYATTSQRAECFCTAHVKALSYFGCAANALVPDNLKSGVNRADRYDPVINPLYAKLAEHYGMVVLPARPHTPRDKAVVESNVLHIQRLVLARLRNRQFFSIADINEAVTQELEFFNNRPMKDYGGQTRKERFEQLDRPFAKPLPVRDFALTALKIDVRVGSNYHIRFDDHFYSVPHTLAGQCVDVYQVGNVIEIYHDHVHVCRHLKGPKNFRYTTRAEHMPAHHDFVRGWSKEWFIKKASEIGPVTGEAVEKIILKQEYHQQAFNAAMGILRLAKTHSPQRLEKACQRALRFKTVSYRSIKSILDQNLDSQPVFPLFDDVPIIEHENIRGTLYYQN